MPQLKEDEWPADSAPTTTEREHLKSDEVRPDGPRVDANGDPELPQELVEKMTPPVD